MTPPLARSLARSFVSAHVVARRDGRARERASEGGEDAFVSTRARRDARRARGGDTRETVTRANDALETNDALDDARGDDGDGGERDVVDDEDDDDARICLLGRRRRDPVSQAYAQVSGEPHTALSLPQRAYCSATAYYTVSGRADGVHSDARPALRSGRGLDAADPTCTALAIHVAGPLESRTTPDRFIC